jgi:hypothetical protein
VKTAVVTAAGVVTRTGDSPEALWNGLAASNGGPSRRIDDFDPRRYVDRRGMKHMSRGSQLACSAAAAVARALEGVDGSTVGVVYGSAWGCLNTIVRFERAAHVDGPRFVDPLLFTETVANVPAGQVSIVYGWSALNVTVSAGTASGLEAIRLAVDLIDEGRASIVVAGGGDEANPHVDGPLRGAPGEGACMVAIESESSARARGVAPLGRIRAVASCFLPRRDSEFRFGRELGRLLEQAELDLREVDLMVLPYGGDSEAIVTRTDEIRARYWDPTRALGECWAANGPAALVATLEAMRRRALPGEKKDGARLERALVFELSLTGHLVALVVDRGSA